MRNLDISPLSPLCGLQHPVAKLVEGFISVQDNWKVDEYFRDRTTVFYDNTNVSIEGTFAVDEIDFNSQRPSTSPVRLLSLKPNYFRGFRRLDSAIDLDGNLVVVDGRNSSGKTSLAEAIEWLLTGQLVRRKLGDAKELADCVANRFRPEDEKTWVEATFTNSEGCYCFKRELLADYNSTNSSLCSSQLYLNSELVSNDCLVSKLFSSVPPLLMQHTIQRFVHDSPSKRRDYFERLLKIDDVTELISRAVVGDDGLRNFQREGGGNLIIRWSELKEMINFDSSLLNATQEKSDALDDVLKTIADEEFLMLDSGELSSAIAAVQEIQQRARGTTFPLLERLRPQRSIDISAQNILSTDEHRTRMEKLQNSESKLRTLQSSEATISEAESAISQALEELKAAGLLEDAPEQICPLCEYQKTPTLTSARISTISQWSKVREALSSAELEFQTAQKQVFQAIAELGKIRSQLIPNPLSEDDWNSVEANQLNPQVEQLKAVHANVNKELARFDKLHLELSNQRNMDTPYSLLCPKFDALLDSSQDIEQRAREYADSFGAFEDALSEIAKSDQEYAKRELWLEVADGKADLLLDLRWEKAKKRAQRELEGIRDSLIQYRHEYLESKRAEFNKLMTNIWSTLREDRFSSFKQLAIPTPRGKGYPVKIEVKAQLDDGNRQHEVDALSVMSESQINVIGIAAFIARSEILGHGCLVMDDPVQSMDDEHFRTFANGLLNHLLGYQFQTIILTHNDLFARDISHSHCDKEDYVTLKIVHSRRDGIKITQGNRRVAERLKIAERLGEDGQLKEAWKFVRLAIERLYTVVMIKHGPDSFDPRSFKSQTAESMWKSGVSEIFEKLVPCCVSEMDEILGFTAAGAHDTPERGKTDLQQSVNFIRPLLSELRVGG